MMTMEDEQPVNGSGSAPAPARNRGPVSPPHCTPSPIALKADDHHAGGRSMGNVTEIHETSQDFHNHRETYEGFLRMSMIGAFHVLCIVVTLAIGGTTHRWALGGVFLIFATIVS